MISPFDYKIFAISCSAQVFFHKTETEIIMIFTMMIFTSKKNLAFFKHTHTHEPIKYTHIQYRSNVSYHFSSCFSRDAYHFSQDASHSSRDESRFSRDASRFARESLKYLVWNILYMYYSQEASVHIYQRRWHYTHV